MSAPRAEDGRYGPPDLIRVESPCPACGESALELRAVEHEVAHFGRTLETLLRCASCGFRNADFMVLDEREPVRLSLHVRSPSHLSARVIRSNSGTWSLPELGFRAEPTPASEAFVTNVEGLLDRALGVLRTAASFQDEADRRSFAESLVARCLAMQQGAEPVTVVIEDPFGNSAIVHDDVLRVALTPEEAAALSPGMVVLDRAALKSDLSDG